MCKKRVNDFVDRKLNLLVGELKEIWISGAGVQETKWFGADVWPAADGYIMLHSGCRRHG